MSISWTPEPAARDRGPRAPTWAEWDAMTPEQREPAAEALPLRYVLDHDAGTGLYRLTLWVGTQSLARAYQKQNHVLVPAGYWVRKE